MSEYIYTVGGTVQPDAGVYITRRADEDLLNACREGQYAYVLTARQLGKSSLMVRTAGRLEEEGIQSVVIDLNELGVQTTVQEWYLGLMFRITSRLRLKVNLLQWWREHEDVGVTQRLSLFFQEIVLRDIDAPVVIFIDEIDTTLSLDFTDDFFAAIRYLFNARSTEPGLQRLSFVLIGVATPSDLINDSKRTPFNIGRRIDLTDFSREESQPLAVGLPGDAARQASLMDKVIDWTNGHPYLTQRLCAELGAPRENGSAGSVNEVVQNIFLGDNAYKDNNLQFVRDMLTKRAPIHQERELLTTYQQIRLGRRRVRDDAHSAVKSHLKLSGVVKRAGDDLQVRNKIYARVFDRKWIRAQWPVSWWELIPFEVKVAAGISLLLFVGLLVAVFYAVGQQQLAQEAAGNLAAEVVLRSTAESDALAQAELAEDNAELAALRAQEAVDNFNLAATRESEAIANAAVAEQNALLAEAQARIAESRALAGEARLAGETNAQLGLLLALEAVQATDTSEARQSVQAALGQPHRFELVHQIEVGEWTSPFGSAAWDPDGRKLLVVNGSDFLVSLWDGESGELLEELRHPGFVTAAFWHPQGDRIVTSSVDGVRVWDAARGVEASFFDVGPTSFTNWAQDGDAIVAVSFSDDMVRIINVAGGGEEIAVAVPEAVLKAEVSRGTPPRLLVTAAQQAYVYDLGGEPLFSIDPPGEIRDSFLWKAAWNDTGDLILTHNAWLGDGTFGPVVIWDGRTGEELQTLETRPAQLIDGLSSDIVPISNAEWGSGGNQVLTSGTDNRLLVWDARSGQIVSEQAGFQEGEMFVQDNLLLSAINFSGFTAGGDPLDRGGFTMRLLPDGELLNLVDASKQVNAVAWSANGRQLATLDLDGTALIWKRPSANPLTVLRGNAAVEAVVWSHDQSKIFVETVDGEVQILDAGSETVLTMLQADSGIAITGWSEDDSQLMIAQRDGSLNLYDSDTGELLQTLSHPAPLFFADWRKNDAQIVTTDQQGTLRVWGVADGEVEFEVRDSAAFLALWNNDQSALIAGGFDGRVRILDAVDGSLQGEIETGLPTLFAFFGLENQDHVVTLSSEGYDFPFFDDLEVNLDADVIDTSVTQLFSDPTELSGWSLTDLETPLWSITYDSLISALPNEADTKLIVHIWAEAVRLGARPLIEIRDMQTGELLFTAEHPGGVVTTLWLDEEQRFVTVGADGKARLWSIDQPEPLAILGAVDDDIADFDINEGGDQLLLGTAGGKVLRTFVDPESLVEIGCDRAYRNLAWNDWQQYLQGQPYQATCTNLPAHPSFIERIEQAGSAAEVATFFATTPQSIDVYGADTWNTVCWWGSLWGQAERVGAACDYGVALAESEFDEANHRDSRALQRALTGDLSGAADDLRAFLTEMADQRDDLSAVYDEASPAQQNSDAGREVLAEIERLEQWLSERTAWVEQLEAGQNPYDAQTIEALIKESQS
ncbi:MAG: AAA-like domain-containing protein [Ardenticatenaceae bacterium]|nr:AAA-like domain-containing protein [Ardenticatenaceae bacterium]